MPVVSRGYGPNRPNRPTVPNRNQPNRNQPAQPGFKFGKWWDRQNVGQIGHEFGVGAINERDLRGLLHQLYGQGASRAQLGRFLNPAVALAKSGSGKNDFGALSQYLQANPGKVGAVSRFIGNYGNPYQNSLTGGGMTPGQTEFMNRFGGTRPGGFKNTYLGEMGARVAGPGEPFAGTVVNAETGYPNSAHGDYNFYVNEQGGTMPFEQWAAMRYGPQMHPEQYFPTPGTAPGPGTPTGTPSPAYAGPQGLRPEGNPYDTNWASQMGNPAESTRYLPPNTQNAPHRNAPLGYHVNQQGQVVPNLGKRLGKVQPAPPYGGAGGGGGGGPEAAQPGTPEAAPGASGLPLSPEYEAARRVLEDNLAAALSQIGVAREQIPALVRVLTERMGTMQGQDTELVRGQLAGRGVYDPEAQITTQPLSELAASYDRQRQDLGFDVAQQLSDLAGQESGAYLDYNQGLAELLLALANQQATTPDNLAAPTPNVTYGTQGRRVRPRNRNK